MCEHNARFEIIQNLIHVQKCQHCGMVREYNPYKKKTLVATDPDLWSQWAESHPIIDKLFQKT